MCSVRLLRFCLTLLLAITGPVLAAGEEWRLEKDQDGIQVSTRAVDGWSIREMRGTAQFHGRLASLVAVIDDVAASPELNEFVMKSSVERRDSDTRYQVYSLTKMPWPLADRDVLTQREIVQDETTLEVTITDAATKDAMPVKNGLVRMTKSRTRWTLTPTADGSVSIELRILSDPGGAIPTSLLNAMSVSAPFNMISRLKKMAQRPQYAQARFAFIKEVAAGS